MTHGIQPEIGHLLKVLQTLIDRLCHERGEKAEITIMAEVDVDIKISVAPGSGGGGELAVDASGYPADATVGVPYNGSMKVSGGNPPYSFALASGAFPDGVVFNAADGSASGTPGTSSNFDAVVAVTDNVGARATARFGNRNPSNPARRN